MNRAPKRKYGSTIARKKIKSTIDPVVSDALRGCAGLGGGLGPGGLGPGDGGDGGGAPQSNVY
jgi:hypothetical protein